VSGRLRRMIEGFTLIEIMVSVGILGLLAAMAVPSFMKARTQTYVSCVANDLRVFSAAFEQRCMETGIYPPDTEDTFPPEMTGYIDRYRWRTPVLGGRYEWEGPDANPYAAVAIVGPNPGFGEGIMSQLDRLVDDGVLTTGRFRLVDSGRYTFVIEE
jgi:prepilin-type N-terminal cleavage/methylation domain-containing protein